MMMMKIQAALHRARGEEGLSLVEVAVAVAVFAVSLIMLTMTVGSGLRGVLMGKQRASANAWAQDTLEQAQGLNFDALGLHTGDSTLAADPSIVADGSGVRWFGDGCTPPPPTSKPDCEKIAYSAIGPGNPFNPHVTPSVTGWVDRGTTRMRRHVYVTGVDRNSDGVFELKRVTVRVQWDRAGVRGVENVVRLSTLISAAPTISSPLVGTAAVENGLVTLRTEIQGVEERFQHNLPLARAEANRTLPSRQATCSAHSQVVQRLGGSTYGPTPESALADDRPPNNNLQVEASKTAPEGGQILSPDIEDPPTGTGWLEQSSIPGFMRCRASVLGDKTWGGTVEGDYLYVDGLASESTSAVSFSLQIDPVVVPGLARISPLRIAAKNAGQVDANSTVREETSGRLVAAGTQGHSGMQFMAVSLSPTVATLTGLDLSAGLVRVDAHEVRTQAGSTAVDCNATPANGECPKATSDGIIIRIYDPLADISGSSCPKVVGNTISQGGLTVGRTGAGYCRFERTVDTVLNVSETIPLSLAASTVWYTVTLNGSSPTRSTTTGPSGSTWRAQVKPLVGQIRLCVSNSLLTQDPDNVLLAPDQTACDVMTGKVLDARADLDLGTSFAQVRRGFA